MKKSTLFSILSFALLLVGFAAMIASFAVYFQADLVNRPAQAVASSLVLLAVSYVALLGMSRAADTAGTYLNTVEHPQWRAQQVRNGFPA